MLLRCCFFQAAAGMCHIISRHGQMAHVYALFLPRTKTADVLQTGHLALMHVESICMCFPYWMGLGRRKKEKKKKASISCKWRWRMSANLEFTLLKQAFVQPEELALSKAVVPNRRI